MEIGDFVLEMSDGLVKLGYICGFDNVGYGRIDVGKAVGDEMCSKRERQCNVLWGWRR